jgi:hypothetical protein
MKFIADLQHAAAGHNYLRMSPWGQKATIGGLVKTVRFLG